MFMFSPVRKFNMSALEMQRWAWWKVLACSGFVDSLVDGCYSSHRTLCLVSRYEAWPVDKFRYLNRFVLEWFPFSVFENLTKKTHTFFLFFFPAPMKHSWPKFRRSRNITYICLWGLVSVGLGIMAIISDIIPAITGVLTFDIFSLVVMISVPLVYFLAGAFAWHLYNDYREDHGKKAAQFDPFKSLGQFR